MNKENQELTPSSIYRPEIVAGRIGRLSGDVVIAVPLSWRLMGYAITTAMFLCILFLFLAGYSRTETASGIIVPDKGIALIVPSRNGVITSLNVKHGDKVNEGTTLLSISVEEHLAIGGSSADQVEVAMSKQNASIALQSASVQEAAGSELEQIDEERKGVNAEVVKLKEQIALQKQLVSSANSDLESAKALDLRGFITVRDRKLREDTLLSRQQQLLELDQRLSTRVASQKGLLRRSATVSAQAKATAASLASMTAQLEQQVANIRGARSYVLNAPFAGTVTALTARIGRYVTTDQPMLSIVPDNATLQAELFVPTTAIGFLRNGQEVRLAIDAFPYQRFGTLKGTVTTISQSAVPSRNSSAVDRPTYPVVVKLENPSIYAFGQDQMLVPDMTLTARIIMNRQTLIEWLFEPLFAVRRR